MHLLFKKKKKGGGGELKYCWGWVFCSVIVVVHFCHQVLGLFPWDFDGSVKKLERMKTEDLLRKRDFKMQLIFICSSLDDELHTLQLRYWSQDKYRIRPWLIFMNSSKKNEKSSQPAHIPALSLISRGCAISWWAGSACPADNELVCP